MKPAAAFIFGGNSPCLTCLQMVEYQAGNEMNQYRMWGNSMSYEQEHDQLREHMEPEQEHYVPRPRWQLILAWVLIAIMVIAVLNICYWQIFRS